MNKDPLAIVKRPVVTEKSTATQELGNAYTFLVDMKANKVEIARAIEKIFKVKVEKVRTQVRKGKPRRMRFKWGKQPDWKRAVVTLKEGKIELLG